MRRFTVSAAVVLMVLVGCGTSEDDVPAPAPPEALPGSSTTLPASNTTLPPESPESPQAPEESEPMDVYLAIEGGFANIMRSITIAADGAATVTVGGNVIEGSTDAVLLETITTQLAQSGLFDEDRTYPAQGADLQRYELRFDNATVIAFDGSIPPSLEEPINLLQQELRRLQTQG